MSAKPAAWTLVLLLAAAAGFPQERRLDRAAAEQYLAQARERAAAGAWAEAEALLDGSLAFFPEYSESLLLRARISLREQAGTRAGLELLARALSSGIWNATEPRAAATELAAGLVRTRRFAEARTVLAALGEGGVGPGLGARDEPQAALLWGRTLVGLGDAAAGARHLELALARYPHDARLYLELARLRGGQPALQVLARGRGALPQAPELVLETARREGGRDRRLELLEEYARLGGANPAAAALALRLGPRDPAAWQERFLSWGGAAAAGPLAELQAFYRSLPQSLAAALQGYSGARTLDRDEDGFYEERYDFQAGGLRRWVLDRDQDGVPEAEVLFEQGLPRSLKAGAPGSGSRLEFRYGSYPWLEGITAEDERGSREYELQPYRERLPLFAGQPPFGSALLRPLRERWPAEEEAARLAFALRETPAGAGGGQRRYTLLAGQVVRLEEEPYAAGRYARVVDYAGGRPVAGRRDLDRDGIFELSESYSEGRLSGLFVDGDGDGRLEYREQLGPEGSRRWWDYDDDGLPDSLEIQSGGTLRREFSSRRDGVFDSAAVFRGAELVEFRRGGRLLPVTPAGGELYWLGRPLARPERFRELPDGLHWLDSAGYFLFSYAGRRYVQQL